MRNLFAVSIVTIVFALAGFIFNSIDARSSFAQSKSDNFLATKQHNQAIERGYVSGRDKTEKAPALSFEFDPHVFFDHTSSKVSNEEYHSIVQDAAIINLIPEAYVVVKGYADQHEGSREFCQKLSEERAQLVQTILVINGLRSDRVISIGEGMDEKPSFNEVETNRQFKRRVEIILTRSNKWEISQAEEKSVKKNVRKPDALVMSVQKALVDRNYDPGPVDGFIGHKTKNAIRQYQKYKNIAVTGSLLDQNTLIALGLKEGIVDYNESSQAQKSGPVENNTNASVQSKEKIASPDRKVQQAELSKSDEFPVSQKAKTGKGKVIENTTLLSEPSFMANVIQNIAGGQNLELFEKTGEFYRTRYRGKEGFIYVDFVEVKENIK